MTYTQAQIDDYAMACPGCGERVEQDWIDVSEDPETGEYRPGRREVFVPGRWTCWTESCEYGPPVKLPGCICPLVDVSTLGDAHTHWTLGGDPQCTAGEVAA